MGGTSPDPKWITIVGIVGDIRHAALDVEPKPEMYVPFAQDPYKSMIFAVRGAQDPRNLASAIRSQIQSIDPGLPLANIRTFDAVIAESVAPRRLSVVLLGVFAAVAVLLATVGIYGVMSFLVVQRTHEIGVRMALGAQPGQIRSQFLYLSLRLLAAGTILGVIGAWLTGQAMQAVLFHVPALNLAILAGAAFVMGVVSLIACLLPSQRASRISPMEALAEE
jgi:ABC-type antimicrobial peptide transport system permease subunit